MYVRRERKTKTTEKKISRKPLSLFLPQVNYTTSKNTVAGGFRILGDLRARTCSSASDLFSFLLEDS